MNAQWVDQRRPRTEKSAEFVFNETDMRTHTHTEREERLCGTNRATKNTSQKKAPSR